MARSARRLLLAAWLAMPATALAAPGPLQGFDLRSAQRGYAVYAEVCSACHALGGVTFADLGGLGLDRAQLRALADKAHVDDPLPRPFPDEASARAANGGALPPDLSREALVVPGGAGFIERLLTGYPTPPRLAGGPGRFVNEIIPGGIIAMPPPLHEGQVVFADHTVATTPQMAHDVATFLDWTARPHLAARHRIGVSVLLYLLLLAILTFLLKRRVWSNVG